VNINKAVKYNLLITLVSKGLSFLLFILLAKTLSIKEYGELTYILMVLTIMPVLHFGCSNGAIITLPRILSNSNDTEEYKSYFERFNSVSNIIQLFSCLILILFIQKNSLPLIVVIIASFLLSKYIENVQLFFNSKMEFYKANQIKALDLILKPGLAILCLFINDDILYVFIGYLISSCLSFTLSLYLMKGARFHLPGLPYVHSLFNVGFIIYLTWLLDLAFRSIDRWFIASFYTEHDLGVYGFTSNLSLNIWLLAISFFGPYSQLLYKQVASGDFESVKETVTLANNKVFKFVAMLSLISISLYPIFTEYFIGKYQQSFYLFFLLVIVSVLLSVNNMYIYYIVSSGRTLILLKIQLLILLLNVTLNCFVAYWNGDISYFAYATILSLVIYHLFLRFFYSNDILKRKLVS